jgi:hypothetical protein
MADGRARTRRHDGEMQQALTMHVHTGIGGSKRFDRPMICILRIGRRGWAENPSERAT